MTVTNTDGATTAVNPERWVHTSRSAMVALTLDAPILPLTAKIPATPVDLVSLELLAKLSVAPATTASAAEEIAAQFGLAPEAALGLIALLIERRVLVESDQPGEHAPSAGSPGSRTADLPEPMAVDPTERHALTVPTLFRIHEGFFEHRGHDGSLLLSLSPIEMMVASAWREPCTSEEALSRFKVESSTDSPEQEWFDAVSNRLRGAQLLEPFDPDATHTGNLEATEERGREDTRRHMRILNATKIAVEQNTATEHLPENSGRVPVIPFHDHWVTTPFSLGMIVAYAKSYRDGELERSYNFVPRWLTQPAKLAEICDRPSIFLFSNYIWNSSRQLEVSARIKSISPTSVTIHGGPDTPKYEGDVQRFFRDHPHVDIAVRGEGEATFAEILEALAGRVGDGPPDLSPLRDVAGLSFRLGDEVVTTGDRDRLKELDPIPSPYLTGLFDSFAAGPGRAAMLETNRGCPYGCTFCDWGSATNSRIRKFDLDRVFDEIEWCASRGFETISLCDANFGIFERDVAIAEKFAEMKEKYGFPLLVGNNYAKNTVKHIKDIIRIFADVGIVAEGVVSLQSMDTQTLQVIRRKNIKVEKYTDLAAEFVANRLPLAVDLMMGLPGSTVQSFMSDLQECNNRDVRIRAHPTTVLTNSPMNDPEYRAEHGIVAQAGEMVKRTNTFDEADWDYMWDLRNVYLLCDLFGVLRQVARYVRSETGVQEVAFYDKLTRATLDDPERWPNISFTFRSLGEIMVPPCSWTLFIEEVRDYLTSVLGIPDDDALQTVLDAQLAHLPSRDRKFPETLEAAHDIAAWHQARVAACEAGHLTDWEQHVPPLRSYGPGSLTVTDPDDLCRTAVGGNTTLFSMRLMAWDFESEIARPRNTHGEQDTPEALSDQKAKAELV